MYIWKSEYFYGNRISEYGLKNGWNRGDNELGFYCSNDWLK